MVDRCENCDRDGCREATSATWAAFVACSCVPNLRDPCEHQRAFHVADAACYDHTVNWRERAKAAESDLTALRERMAVAELRLTRIAERATAMTRAGVGTVEPWAQAGRVLREIAGQMLECLRGEDVPAVVLIPADDWVPVTERLPEESAVVLAFDSGRIVEGWTYIDCDGDVRWCGRGSDLYSVTHWRPMPAPPEPQASSSSRRGEVENG